MALAYLEKEIEPQAVRDEITSIIKILRRRENFSRIEPHAIIFEMIRKLDEIIVQLQQTVSVLRNFLDGNTYIEKFASFMESDQEVNTLLEEVQESIEIAESCILKMRQVRINLENEYLLLILLILGGIRIPQMEDFDLPVQMPNTVQDSLEGGNTTGPITERRFSVMTLLISSIANHFAGIRMHRNLLETAVTAFTIITYPLVNEVSQFWAYRKVEYDKILSYKREFDKCIVKAELNRLRRYLEEIITNTHQEECKVIKQCLGQIWDSVEDTKQKNPNKSEIDIIKEMSEMPVCSGLVSPIATKIGCTIQEAWNFVLQQTSSGHDPPALCQIST